MTYLTAGLLDVYEDQDVDIEAAATKVKQLNIQLINCKVYLIFHVVNRRMH